MGGGNALPVRSEGVHGHRKSRMQISGPNTVQIRVQELCKLEGSSCENLHTFTRAVDLASLAVFWAPNQQNAAGMRISGASPWQQMNATAVGSSGNKAQRSSQQGGSGASYLIKLPSHLLEPSAERQQSQISPAGSRTVWKCSWCMFLPLTCAQSRRLSDTNMRADFPKMHTKGVMHCCAGRRRWMSS